MTKPKGENDLPPAFYKAPSAVKLPSDRKWWHLSSEEKFLFFILGVIAVAAILLVGCGQKSCEELHAMRVSASYYPDGTTSESWRIWRGDRYDMSNHDVFWITTARKPVSPWTKK